MSHCENAMCDAVRAAALQTTGVWDALLEAAHLGDPEIQDFLQQLGDRAPRLMEALQGLADELGDAS